MPELHVPAVVISGNNEAVPTGRPLQTATRRDRTGHVNIIVRVPDIYRPSPLRVSDDNSQDSRDARR